MASNFWARDDEDLLRVNNLPQQNNQSAPQQQGGILGFLKHAAQTAIEPAKYFTELTMVSPARQSLAKITGNKEAFENAKKEEGKKLGFGESGQEYGKGLKKFIGNALQVGSMLVPGGGVAKGVATGASAGAGAGLAEDNSSAEDVLKSAGIGGLTGGVLSGAGTLLGKLANRGSGATSGLGAGLDAEASGISRGNTLKGGRTVFPDYESELQDFLRNGSKEYVEGGVKTGKPRTQSSTAQEVFNNVKKRLGQTLDDINRPIEMPDKVSIRSRVSQAIDEDAGITGTPKTWEKLSNKIEKAEDLKTLEKIRREADDLAFTQEKAGKTSAARQARHVRDAIDEYVTPESDAYKAIKKDYRLAKDALELTTKGTKNAQGARIPFTGVEVAEQSLTGAKSKVGGLMSGTSKGIGSVAEGIQNATDQVPSVLRRLSRQGVTAGAATYNPTDQQPVSQEQEPQAVEGEIINGEFVPTQQATAGTDNGAEGMLDPATIQATAQQILAQGGTYSDVAKYLSVVKSMQELTGGSGTTSQAADKAANASTVINELDKRFQEAGGAQGRVGGILGKLGGKVGLNDKANAYESLRQSFLSQISRALGEVGTLTDQDIARVSQAIPSISDNPEEAQIKLATLRQILSSIQSNAGGGQTPSLESALTNIGY